MQVEHNSNTRDDSISELNSNAKQQAHKDYFRHEKNVESRHDAGQYLYYYYCYSDDDDNNDDMH